MGRDYETCVIEKFFSTVYFSCVCTIIFLISMIYFCNSTYLNVCIQYQGFYELHMSICDSLSPVCAIRLMILIDSFMYFMMLF